MVNHDVLALCRRQHGLVTRAQAMGAGLTPRQIKRRVISRDWQRLLPGVYLVGTSRPTWEVWAHAALLAAGREAVLVGPTAAQIRGLEPRTLPIWPAIPAERR